MVRKPYPDNKPTAPGWCVCGLADRQRDRKHPKPEVYWWSPERDAFVTGCTKVIGVTWFAEVE